MTDLPDLTDLPHLPDLTSFAALSFDCYGTLIDWESGIADVLVPWAASVGLDPGTHDREALLLDYADKEAAVEREHPTWLYPRVLAEAFRRTGTQLGYAVTDEWAQRLGSSVPSWPAFPDSSEALAELAQHYDLIILSNIDRADFTASNARLHEVAADWDFARIITAEDVGAYKPAEPHFRALDAALTELGHERSELLHVAQSLFHDHVPAKREGLSSVWVNRRHDTPGWGATPEPGAPYSYDLEFPSMGAFADAVREAFAAQSKH